MPDKPFVSVIIPTFNSESTIGECLDSLVEQDYPREWMEIIVVDSGEDNTGEICTKYNVRYYYSPECDSPGKARNLGVKLAKGEMLAFLDSDCIAPRNWLTKIIEDYSEFPEVVGVIGFYTGGNDMVERIINKECINDRKEVGVFLGFVEGNSSFKRGIFEKGLKFGEFKYAEGCILAYQLMQHGYKMLRDYSLKVIHLGFTYTLPKWFKIGRAFYQNSKTYYKDLYKELLFCIFILSSPLFAIYSALSGTYPYLLLIPFISVNCIFGFFALKAQAPLHLHVIPIILLLILMRWLLWFGFAYEWVSDMVKRVG